MLYTLHKIYTKSETYSTAYWQAIIQTVMDMRLWWTDTDMPAKILVQWQTSMKMKSSVMPTVCTVMFVKELNWSLTTSRAKQE